MCEENTAKVALLESDVQELRRAIELVRQKMWEEKANNEGRAHQQVKDDDREEQENMSPGPSRHQPFRHHPKRFDSAQDEVLCFLVEVRVLLTTVGIENNVGL
ncbi:hypothetical protein Aduo_002548 [Ancylostoma duodenale]